MNYYKNVTQLMWAQTTHFNYSRKVIFTKQNDVKLIYLANKNIIYFKTLIKNVQQKNFAT